MEVHDLFLLFITNPKTSTRYSTDNLRTLKSVKMVLISKIVILSAFAVFVAATPVPEVPSTSSLSQSDVEVISTVLAELAAASSNHHSAKRGDNLSLSPVATLLMGAGKFLGDTITNLLHVDLAAESTDIANLLIGINQFLLNLETALQQYNTTAGLGTALQDLLINSGLQSFVLALTTIVTSLTTFLLAHKTTIDPAIQDQIRTLNDHLASLGSKYQQVNEPAAQFTQLSSILAAAMN